MIVTTTTRIAVTALALAMAFAARAAEVSKAQRAAVVSAMADQLEQQYVHPAVGKNVARALRKRLAHGAYDGYDDGDALAKRFSQDLQELAGVGHLKVEYSAEPTPEETAQDSAEEEARWRERLLRRNPNFGFRRVEQLDDNIGVLKLDVFFPTAVAGDTAAAAMRLLNNTRALIIDLRQNGGGDGDMANLLSAYLFDTGGQSLSSIYSRPNDKLTQNHIQHYVPGPRYGEGKPVYILTSHRTFSAAEGFTYDLQALGRVKVIGEATGGGAQPFELSRLDPHFTLWLEKERSINPITGSNWQGRGVQPDVVVNADQAMDTALALARETLAVGGAASGN